MTGPLPPVLGSMRDQLAGTFLAPGSTFSLGALAASSALFLLVALPRGRRVRAKVLWRALVPRRLWRSASGRADLLMFAGGVLLSGLAIGWAVVSADAVRAALDRGWGAPPATAHGRLATLLATVVLFLAYEFAYWLDHWLSHAVPLLWRFHKVHHQAEHLSLATNGRVHPVDTIKFANITAGVLGVTGAGLDRVLGPGVAPFGIGGTNMLVMAAAVGITHLQHSHLPIGFGPHGGRWLLGPLHHQLHHSTDPRHFNRNLGSSLALWDRLFGTLMLPTPRERLRFGVDDPTEPAPHELRAMLWTPFAAAAGDLVTWVRRSARAVRAARGRSSSRAADRASAAG